MRLDAITGPRAGSWSGSRFALLWRATRNSFDFARTTTECDRRTFVKDSFHSFKIPFGTAKFSRIKNVRYLSWEDAFDVEFEDGLCILEPHLTIRRANKISSKANFNHLEGEECAT